MLALGIAVLALARPSEVAEFFPLDFGRTWVYNEAQGTVAGVTSVVGVEQDLLDKKLNPVGKGVPIVKKVGDDVVGCVFYRIVDDQVFVVAFDQNRPLASPYPIIKLGPGKTTWSYKGETQWVGEMSPMALEGSCKRGPAREIQGNKYDTIEVTIDVVIGDPDGMCAKTHQTSVYGRGVGLIELVDQSTFNKTKKENKRKLISFAPGKGA